MNSGIWTHGTLKVKRRPYFCDNHDRFDLTSFLTICPTMNAVALGWQSDAPQ